MSAFLPGASEAALRTAVEHGMRITFPMLLMSTRDFGDWTGVPAPQSGFHVTQMTASGAFAVTMTVMKVGGFPIPGTGRIGCAKGRLHRTTQDSCIDAMAAFEIGQKLSRNPDNSGGNSVGGTHQERRGGAAAGERFGHGRMSRESE